MNNYANNLGGIYQAPNAASGYEPDGSTTQDGSNLTDFDSLCTDCHDNSNNIYSTLLGRNLYKFNWANEMHGGYAATYCGKGGPPPTTSLLAAPYDGLTKCGQYVLACTDCHEPHGSPNNFLVRKWVNNGFNDCTYCANCSACEGCSVSGPLPVTVTNYGAGNGPDDCRAPRANKEWVYLCGKCHTGLNVGGLGPHHAGFILCLLSGYPADCDPTSVNINPSCITCHTPSLYNNCKNCHFHGNKNIPGYGNWIKPLF
jgi:predicted CXXCH cytochrome family protein